MLWLSLIPLAATAFCFYRYLTAEGRKLSDEGVKRNLYTAVGLACGCVGLIFVLLGNGNQAPSGTGVKEPVPVATPSVQSANANMQMVGNISAEKARSLNLNVPTPLPTPTPTPQISSSVKQIGDDLWRVTVSGKGWYDSRIPVVALHHANISRMEGTKGKWLVKAGRESYFGEHSARIEFEERSPSPGLIIDHEFRDTLKFKVDDEGGTDVAYLIVRVSYTGMFTRGCRAAREPDIKSIHTASFAWYNEAKKTIGRR